jgi:hypothetical protein
MFSNFEAQIPANAKPGQYARFNAIGRFMEMTDYLSNGLGLTFQVQRDGTLRRVFF